MELVEDESGRARWTEQGGCQKAGERAVTLI